MDRLEHIERILAQYTNEIETGLCDGLGYPTKPIPFEQLHPNVRHDLGIWATRIELIMMEHCNEHFEDLTALVCAANKKTRYGWLVSIIFFVLLVLK